MGPTMLSEGVDAGAAAREALAYARTEGIGVEGRLEGARRRAPRETFSEGEAGLRAVLRSESRSGEEAARAKRWDEVSETRRRKRESES